MMSNSHSKPASNYDNYYDYYDDDDDYSDNYNNEQTQTLAIYIEEVDTDTGLVDMRCYVLYDRLEREYFICGKRKDQSNMVFSSFNLYCKKRKNVLKIMNNLIDTKNNCINYTLYNFEDVFYDYSYNYEYDCLDFAVLDNKRNIKRELNGYDSVEYDTIKMKSMLSIIKHVRY